MSAAGPVLFAYDGSDVVAWGTHVRSAGLGRLAVPDSVTREAIAALDAEAERAAAD